jgi:hypothetical protein
MNCFDQLKLLRHLAQQLFFMFRQDLLRAGIRGLQEYIIKRIGWIIVWGGPFVTIIGDRTVGRVVLPKMDG